MGHASLALALKVYAHAVRRGDDERERLAELVTGEKARKGTNGGFTSIEYSERQAA